MPRARILPNRLVGGGFKVGEASGPGPASYTAGGFTFRIDNFYKVDRVLSARASGGYMVEVAGVSGNAVTLKVYYFDYAAAAAGTAVEVPDGTDLSGVTFTVEVIGY